MMKSSLILINLIFILLVLFIPNLTSAETKTFIKEYTYQASEYDSKVSCRTLALEQAKRLLLEELGTYLESETEVKNYKLTKDQVVILTAGIVSAEIIDEKWDGKTYYLKSKIMADPSDVASSIEKLRQNRQKTKDLEEVRIKADEALREVERLKKELEIAKTGKIERDQYQKAVNSLSATDWFQKGYSLGIAGRHQESMEAFTRAIELSPKFATAYYNRGDAYGELGDLQLAIKDYSSAIDLNPKDALTYFARGTAYSKLGNDRQAIMDFDKAIKLIPKFALAYYYRGIAYDHLDDYNQAIRDYNKAIGLVPKYAEAYSGRGVVYGKLGNYQQAIKDFDRAIALNHKDKSAYYNRGIAYGKVGDSYREIVDSKTAAKLGYKPAQDYLRSRGINW